MTQYQNQASVDLKSSPLFNLSLTSKELFHSNFLCWLGQTYPKVFEKMCEQLGCNTTEWPEGWTVEREHKVFKAISLDLCVKGGDKLYMVLENKVKSVPNLPQLTKYAEVGTPHQGCNFVLLSLATDFLGKEQIGEPWIIWNYGNLAAAIKSAMSSCGQTCTDYHKSIILDYVQFAKSLHNLFGKISVKDTDQYIIENGTLDEYVELRMDDVYEKLRSSQITGMMANKMAERLRTEIPDRKIEIEFGRSIAEIKEEAETPLTKVYMDSSYTRNHGLIEAKVKVNKEYVLTVQVQGKQYRHVIERFVVHGNNDATWKEMQKESLQEWFNFTAEGKTLNDSRKEYCVFGSKFLYRYRNVEKETVVDILNEIIEDIIHIFKSANQFPDLETETVK